MESKNNSEESQKQLCTNCQSFYGGHDTNFLCSKCYKEYLQKQQSPSRKSPIKNKEHLSNLEEKKEQLTAAPSSQQEPLQQEQKSEQTVEKPVQVC